MQERETSEELKTLKRIECLLETIAKGAVAEMLKGQLEDRSTRILYENTGRLTRPQLEKRTGFSAGKISNLWKRWEQEGIVTKAGRSYRRVL